MARVAEIKILVKDTRWFREVVVRLSDLLEALKGEDLSPETERKIEALRRALPARHEDDLPEP